MITERDIENLAELSRIKLMPDEKLALMKEIGSILAYVDQIKKADVSISKDASIGAVKNVSRSDEPRKISPEDREQILDEAPDRIGDFVAVKKIL
ncbi:MAG: glutamyl-tRNA(Gln) and/or aspartyl-tRNA(Asn) amidotransferase subunit [Candidatus Taylorbacteria bacterium]|nr:glutamyl-tRNA(Gln) and/or aspartyl-tRNA(Asn) amidotransferase subunit [Candidatus Taylorbacteria bacterium]